MLSFWEKKSFIQYDIIIVGAGITGLSTAASLKEKAPNLNVLVLERGLLPTGASTKNAGFACFGSLTELLGDIDAMGEGRMLQLVEKRWLGLQKARDRLGNEAIDLRIEGGHELLAGSQLTSLDRLSKVNDLLRPILGMEVFQDRSELIHAYGFGRCEKLIYNGLEGQLDTGKLMTALWTYCNKLGVKVVTGAEVNSWGTEKEDSHWVQAGQFRFEARSLVFCTNAFSSPLFDVDLRPGRGIVLAVQPEEPLSFQGTFHYDEGYYYFRDFYGKLIFGGGRNLDLQGEETLIFDVNQQIRNRLIEDLQTRILPNREFRVEQEWSGIMAFGDTKEPVVRELTAGVFAGVRLGGMGVAVGSMVGEELAGMVLKAV